MTISDLQIRPAGARDAGAISRLLGELEHPASAGEVRDRLQELRVAGDEVLIAILDKATVGPVALHTAPMLHHPHRLGRITALVVSASCRGRGLGAAMVKAAETWLAARGCRSIEVTSHNRRAAAHRFYEQIGFARSHARFLKDL